MEWSKLLSQQRYSMEYSENYRDTYQAFQKDIDKIIFSNAFRRLTNKTQGHPFPNNDHVHTRLIHSLEASCVGRNLGMLVGERLGNEIKSIGVQPSDIGAIVQAACLVHDIGNPPFGHSGEEAIRYWFKENMDKNFLNNVDLNHQEINDFIYFDGNAQGLRIITKIEYCLFNGGMQLTYATLGTFLKYPWTSDLIVNKDSAKYGCHQSELPILLEIASHLGLEQKNKTEWCRHPLSYLMEAADDICYTLIDLEDGIEMGLLSYDEVIKILSHVVDFEELSPIYHQLQKHGSYRQRISFPREKAIEIIVNKVVDTFMREKDSLLSGNFEYNDLIHASGGKVEEFINQAKSLTKDKIFYNHRRIKLELGAYATFDILLNSFIKAAYNLYNSCDGCQSLSFKDKRILELMGANKPQKEWTLYNCYMRILDYIIGMTDNYATDIGQQLIGLLK